MTSPAERRAKALELHLAGVNYDTIAATLKYASRSGAHKAVQQALDAQGKPASTGEATSTEMARLDAMLSGLWPKARRGDVAAVDRVLRIEERRRLLLFELAPGATPPASMLKSESGLSEFERKLRERTHAAAPAPRTARK